MKRVVRAQAIGPIAACAVLFALSMWMRGAFPVVGLGTSEFDDLLFVRLAASILEGHWLGPYGNLTLAKGAALSAFIAANHWTGIPYKLTEHFVYLCACWYFAASTASLLRFRHAFVVLFALLALNPVVWAPDVGGRVVREDLYVSLGLLLMGLSFRIFLAADAGDAAKGNGFALFLFGVTGGAFWLTREEGVWIGPALAIPFAWWAVRVLRAGGGIGAAVPITRSLALALAGFALVVLTVNALNYRHYGVFANNEFRSSEFPAAYGALSRIAHDRYARYVVLPHDARMRAYSASVLARQLEPFLDGETGRRWSQVSCQNMVDASCDEILSGWFMWALRDATAGAGHYRTAREAAAFYKALAAEIDAACDAGRIACGPAHHSLVPPWRDEFIGWTTKSALRIARTLATFDHMAVRTEASTLSHEQATLLEWTTHEKPGTVEDGKPEGLRYGLARAILAVQRTLQLVSLPAGLIALGLALYLGGLRAPSVALLAVLAALGARVALLAFLDATSIASNNLLYLSPIVPFSIVLGPAAAMALLRDPGA